MHDSPLGRFANLGALVASVGAVVASVYAHLTGLVDPFLDTLAVLGFGVLIGQRGGAAEANLNAAQRANGQEAKIAAAHVRLDKIHAPPANRPVVDEVPNGTP